MRQEIVVMLVLAIAVSVSFADAVDDYSAARALFRAKEYAAAEAAFAEIATAKSQLYVGHSLYRHRKYAEALTAFSNTITNYPDGPVNILCVAQTFMGVTLLAQGKPAEAQVEFAKVLTDYPTASPVRLARAHRYIGLSLAQQGLDGSAAFLAVADYGDTKGLRAGVVTFAPYMTTESFVAYLYKVLQIVPAIEANADFLGRVRSQINVLE